MTQHSTPAAATGEVIAPLNGVRILDLSRFLPGGYLTTLLADLGADVIKIEEPTRGDPMRHEGTPFAGDTGGFWVAGRNKRSLALDLKTPAGVDTFIRLAGTADVVLESFRPGVATRLGIDYETLSERYPGIVYAALTGYGSDGSMSQIAGHDINYLGYAGVLGMTGAGGGPPALPGVQVADLGGASLLGIGLLAALFSARQSGRGRKVEVSMYDAALSWTSVHAGEYWASGQPTDPGQALLTGRYPCYYLYECADGRYLAVGAVEARFWKVFCDLIDRPELLSRQHDESAVDEVAATLKLRTRDDWARLLGQEDACVAPVLDLGEALSHPLAAQRAMVRPMAMGDGTLAPNLASAVRFDGRPCGLGRPAPQLGEDSLDVLGELDSGIGR